MSRRSRIRRASRAARNQARHAEHIATQATKIMTGGATGDVRRQSPTLHGSEPVGSYASVMNSGSVQGSPARIRVGGGNQSLGIASPDPSSRQGIKLQPFRDYVPSTPSDYGAGKVDHLTQRQVWLRDPETGEITGRVFEAYPHEREKLDTERARVRDQHEAAAQAADRPSGVAGILTGSGGDEGARHEDDEAANLYRDGLGRIVRTLDMDENSDRWITGRTAASGDWHNADPVSLTTEVDEVTSRVRIMEVNGRTGERRRMGRVVARAVDSTMSTTDYATLHGVPVQRNATQRADASGKAKAEARAQREADRDAKRAAREADRLARQADKPARQAKSGAGGMSRGEVDEAARLMLAKMGVTSPSREHLRLAREAVVFEAQVAEYAAG